MSEYRMTSDEIDWDAIDKLGGFIRNKIYNKGEIIKVYHPNILLGQDPYKEIPTNFGKPKLVFRWMDESLDYKSLVIVAMLNGDALSDMDIIVDFMISYLEKQKEKQGFWRHLITESWTSDKHQLAIHEEGKESYLSPLDLVTLKYIKRKSKLSEDDLVKKIKDKRFIGWTPKDTFHWLLTYSRMGNAYAVDHAEYHDRVKRNLHTIACSHPISLPFVPDWNANAIIGVYNATNFRKILCCIDMFLLHIDDSDLKPFRFTSCTMEDMGYSALQTFMRFKNKVLKTAEYDIPLDCIWSVPVSVEMEAILDQLTRVTSLGKRGEYSHYMLGFHLIEHTKLSAEACSEWHFLCHAIGSMMGDERSMFARFFLPPSSDTIANAMGVVYMLLRANRFTAGFTRRGLQSDNSSATAITMKQSIEQGLTRNKQTGTFNYDDEQGEPITSSPHAWCRYFQECNGIPIYCIKRIEHKFDKVDSRRRGTIGEFVRSLKGSYDYCSMNPKWYDKWCNRHNGDPFLTTLRGANAKGLLDLTNPGQEQQKEIFGRSKLNAPGTARERFAEFIHPTPNQSRPLPPVNLERNQNTPPEEPQVQFKKAQRSISEIHDEGNQPL